VGTEAVRAADRGRRRDQVERAGGDAVVFGSLVWDELPGPERAHDDGPDHCGGQRQGREPRKPCDAEYGGGNQERDDRRRVVELDRGLGRDVGEEIGAELRERGDEQERRGQEHPRERQPELQEVGDVAAFRDRADQRQRVRDSSAHDPPERAADGVVALVELGRRAAAEVRHHERQ